MNEKFPTEDFNITITPRDVAKAGLTGCERLAAFVNVSSGQIKALIHPDLFICSTSKRAEIADFADLTGQRLYYTIEKELYEWLCEESKQIDKPISVTFKFPTLTVVLDR